MKFSIRQNVYGNWYGYEGGRRVESFALEPSFMVASDNPQASSAFQSIEAPTAAVAWLAAKQAEHAPTFTTYGAIPKSLSAACARHAGKVLEIGNEGSDGYWVYLKPGWIWDKEVHCIHEYTVADVVRGFERVSKCECKDCLQELARIAKEKGQQ